MTPAQRKQIEDKLRKREFAELSKKPGVWIRGTTPNMRTVDLTKLSTEFLGLPIVCISTGIERIEQGHGITEIDDIRSEIAGILKHKGTDEQKEQPAPKLESKGLPENVPDSSTLGEIKMPKAAEVPKRSLAGELDQTKDYKGDVGWEKPFTKPIHKPDAIVPARMAAPQGNYIKGLVPMMKEIGKIKIGTKGEVKTSQRGTQYRPPMKFDHFEIVSVLRDDNGNLIPDLVMKELGENPKELDIFLLYNDETLNFTTRYNEYKGGKCQCSGDGVKARLINGDEIECNPDTCKVFKEKRCKPNGILSVILTKSPRLGGVYKFRTTSYNSIRSILSSLFFLKSLTGGVLAMIPLKLTVSPMTVQPKDSMTAQTIYVVNVEFAGTVQQLLEKTVEVSKYQSMMRANIKQLEATARASLAIPETEEESKEIQAEFYPEKPEEAKAEAKS